MRVISRPAAWRQARRQAKKSSHAGCSMLLRYQKWLTFLFCLANIRCHAGYVN